MRALSKLQQTLMAAGAVLMLLGALLAAPLPGRAAVMPALAPWVYAVGALAFVTMQFLQRYEGDSFTIQRLRRIMLMSDVLLILVAALMFADLGNPFGLDHFTWLNYIHNNWVIALLLAALIQLYTVYRIDAELKEEAKKR